MNQPRILKLKCPNPECGADIRGPHPEKAGVFKISCPKCKKQLQMAVGGDSLEKVTLTEINITAPGINVGSKQVKAITLDDDFFINETYNVKCPHCSNATIELRSPKAGKAKKTCPACGNMVIMEFKSHTYIPQYTDDGTPKLKVSYKVKGFLHTRKLEFPLTDGVYVIGRKDPQVVCEIPVDSDPTMSRRSVEITAMRLPSGYNYRLRVMKATNPVMLNGAPLDIGAIVSLREGDRFVLGKTEFKVEKA